MNAFDRIRDNARSRKLCKDPANGIIFGVCAGVAWWLGVKSWFVRLVAVIALLLWTGPVLLSYVVAALILNRRPVDRMTRFEERFDRFRHEFRDGFEARRDSGRDRRCHRDYA